MPKSTPQNNSTAQAIGCSVLVRGLVTEWNSGFGSVFPRQHDSEAVELISDGPEGDFSKGEVRASQLFGLQDVIVAVVCCEGGGLVWIDGEFPYLEIFSSDCRRSSLFSSSERS